MSPSPIPTKSLPDHLIESLIRWGRLSGPDAQGRILGYYTGSQPAAYVKCQRFSKFASIWTKPVLQFPAQGGGS
jgi:hypothetical protein